MLSTLHVILQRKRNIVSHEAKDVCECVWRNVEKNESINLLKMKIRLKSYAKRKAFVRAESEKGVSYKQ